MYLPLGRLMASTFTFGAFVVPAGTTVLGPVVVPASWTRARYEFDGAAQVEVMSVLTEYSTDGGASWIFGSLAPYDPGTWIDRDGNPQTYRDGELTFARPVAGNLRVRLTIFNPTAFSSAGGMLLIE